MPNTMVSTIACSAVRSRPAGPSPWFAWLFIGWFCLAMASVQAAEITVSAPQLEVSDDGLALSADFALDLNPVLEEAVNRGVVLHFVIDFELNRPRWYWLDEKLFSRSQTMRLSYHALTRQYRLANGALHQNFDSLSSALRVLSRLRYWQVVDKSERALLRAGETLQAAVRMRLDLTQLPRPFQVAAIGNRDWSLQSDWLAWQYVLPAEAR